MYASSDRSRSGFSLIEILISVLILALGLLGLGALFPVVLREQRIASENIQGVLVANNTRAMLAQMDLNALLPTSGPPNRDVWSNWRWRQSNGTAELDKNPYQYGQWYVADVDADGAAEFGDRNSTSAIRLPLAVRLHPSDGGDKGRPQFVWDIAVHRVSDFVAGNSSLTDPLQAVIFVRRIDPRIRVGPGRTLRQVLIGDGISAGERRLPVGRQNGSTFLPTLDGTDGSGGLRYSTPVTADRGTDFDIIPGDGKYVVGVDIRQANGKGGLMAQPNQRLVDNLGNVYTVEAIEQDPATISRSRLRINPPIASPLTEAGPVTRPRVVSFVFTPQVPAAVAVMEVLP